MLLKELQTFSSKYGIYPRKNLGQNFIIDESILSILSEFSPNKNVLEIGSGFGFLTKELLSQCKHLTAVEIDEKLYTLLRIELSSFQNLTLLNKDFLSLNLSDYPIDIIISAPPYFISKEIIKKIIISDIPEAVLLMQREFLEKITSLEGEADYKAISVFFHSFYSFEILKFVGKHSFYPSPSIDSAIIHFTRKKSSIPPSQRQEYFKFLTQIFRHRNKTISNSLSLEHYPPLSPQSKLKDIKVMQLTPKEFLSLFSSLSSILKLPPKPKKPKK